MPVAYKVKSGDLPGCAACSMVGHTHEQSLISKPSWIYATRTSTRELLKIRSARQIEIDARMAALQASGVSIIEARVQAASEIFPKHPEQGYEHWLLRGCDHAKVFCEWPTVDKVKVEGAWQDEATRIFNKQAAERVWSPGRMGIVAKVLGFIPEGEIPPLMACPKCADVLFAERVRPSISPLTDGRWQISPMGGCPHIPDTDKSRATTPEELATRWNGWAQKKLEERLAIGEFEAGNRYAFAVACSAR